MFTHSAIVNVTVQDLRRRGGGNVTVQDLRRRGGGNVTAQDLRRPGGPKTSRWWSLSHR